MELALSEFGRGAGGWSSADAFPRRVGDVNGDGRADIVGFGEAGTYVALGQADGSFAAPKLAIAEFVENDAILQELIDLGVDYVQGYGIGRPAPLR